MAQRGEIQCAESQFALQSGRRRKCEKFQVGRHLAEEAQPRLPLFVFPTRPISQPPSRHEERLSYILDLCPPSAWCNNKDAPFVFVAERVASNYAATRRKLG